MTKTPPRMPFPYAVVNDLGDLPDGGARRLKDRVAAPMLTQARMRELVDAAPPLNSPDWVSEYKGKFALQNQGESGACTACAGSVGIQWRRYRKDGKAIDLSWPDLYYKNVMWRDPNGSAILGSMVSAAIAQVARDGICTDALHPQAAAFVPNIHAGVRRRPSPEAYADALTRKVRKWSSVPPDPQVWMQLINAGYFVCGAVANHAVTFAMYTEGYWFFSFDSMRAELGGIRAFNRDLLLASGWDFCVVEDVAEGIDDGWVPPSGQLEVPSSLVFPDKPVGQIGSMTVQPHNIGGQPVLVQNVWSNHAAFVPRPFNPTRLQPGYATNMAIDFRPPSAARFNGLITIASDGLGNPQSIPVTGRGIADASPDTTPPPGVNVETIAQIKADAAALDATKPVTQAQKDNGLLHWSQLVVGDAAASLTNGGFESPNLAGGFQYAPTGATWVFSGAAGISGNGSAFTNANPAAPDGTQVALLQNSNSQIAQTVNIPAAGSYTVSLRAAQRGNYQVGAQVVRLQMDGVTIGQYQPPNKTYSTYQTSPFSIASPGNHTLTLTGVGSGSDFTAFVDDVRLISAGS